MAHDPTSNESDSTQGMAFGASSDSIVANAKRKPRRKIDLSESDAALIDRTRSQIRELVDEVRRLSQTDCSSTQFNEGMLSRVVMALASVGGAVWIRESNDTVEKKAIQLQCHVNLKQTVLRDNEHARKTHGKLVERVFESAEPILIPPSTGSDDAESGSNPTEHLLIFSPIIVDGNAIGLVEVFQRPGAGPATQRGYLKFLSQVCDIAAEFFSRSRLRTFEHQQKTWKNLESFVHLIHRKLDVKDTVYAIANEGRRLIDCDRVSVATMQGKRCVVKTVSGLDAIERRSEQVKTLGRLATTVVRSGKPLWYVGNDKDLAPKIEKRVQEHVANSHSRMTAVIPLLRVEPDPESDDPFARAKPAGNEKPVGALIVELLNEADVSETLRERTELVAAHAQTALSNSIEHQSIFLMPLWKAMGVAGLQFQGRRLIRTAIACGLAAVAVAFLCLFPYSFSLGSKGSLVPERQNEIYAHIDGILTDINVSNTGDTTVEKEQVVATMASSALELKIGNIQGQIAQAKNELRIAETGKTTGKDAEEIAAYAFQFERAKQEIANLESELAIQKKDRELLTVRAPIAGQVVNWQVRQNLLRRPVRFGQHLMTIVPHDTQWLIELEMPERRLAHLSRAMEDSAEHLQVTFALLSWPGKEFKGELISVDQKLDVYSDEGNAALVRVRFPNDAVPQELLKSGTRVTGKIHCGTRSIGYAMFYELIETVQSKWQFWF